MTLRQALSALGRGWYVIVIVVLLAGAVAGLFLQYQTPVYTSQITLRASALSTTAVETGQIGTASVDFDPEAIRTVAVLGPAARRVGDPASASASWNVTYTVEASQAQRGTGQLTITADGRTATLSQRHAAAVAASYREYLSSQIADARAAAEAQAAKWTAAAQAAQAVVAATPPTQTNAIAQANLTNALKSLSDATSTIDTIDNAGPPIVVSKASEPGVFQGTTPLIAMAVALSAGLIAGIGLAFVRDALDDRLRSEEEIDPLTGAPSLGALSLDRSLRRRKERLPAAGAGGTPLAEDLRGLRTTLQVLLPAEHGVVVVTSVEPGEGKTFVSSNLAVTWARAGKRVILVGGDLRRPGLAQYFGDAAGGRGLSDLLRAAAAGSSPVRTADVRAAVRPTSYPGLDLLPAGSATPDPADLLATSPVKDVIAGLRSSYDVVVIDSPPSLALTDASLLAAFADGAVIVASVLGTRRRQLVETADELRANGVALLGVVANRSRRVVPRTYAAYYGVRPGAPAAVGVRDARGEAEDVPPVEPVEPAAAAPAVVEDPAAAAEAPAAPARKPRAPRKPRQPAASEPDRG